MSLSLFSLHSIAAKEAAIARVLFHLKGLEEKTKESIKEVSHYASSPNKFYLWYSYSQIQFYSFHSNTTYLKISYCSEFVTVNETRVSESLYVLKG